MAEVAKINGVKELMVKLRRSKKVTVEGLQAGLIEGGLFIQRKSQLQVPVLTGNLKASAFTRVKDAGKKIKSVTVGYTASYAIFVHEIISNHHPVGKAKFLEDPVKENRGEILKIIANKASEYMGDV